MHCAYFLAFPHYVWVKQQGLQTPSYLTFHISDYFISINLVTFPNLGADPMPHLLFGFAMSWNKSCPFPGNRSLHNCFFFWGGGDGSPIKAVPPLRHWFFFMSHVYVICFSYNSHKTKFYLIIDLYIKYKFFHNFT